MPKRTIEIVDKQNAKKIKTEEINNESTTKLISVTDSTQEEITNKPSTSKKNDYNFWMKINKPNDVIKNKPVEYIKIDQLNEGKMYDLYLSKILY